MSSMFYVYVYGTCLLSFSVHTGSGCDGQTVYMGGSPNFDETTGTYVCSNCRGSEEQMAK